MTRNIALYAVLAAVVLLLLGSPLVASTAPQAPDPTVVRVVDLQKAIDGLAQKSAMEEDLQGLIALKEADLQQLRGEISALESQLQDVIPQGSQEYVEALASLSEKRTLYQARLQAQSEVISIYKGGQFATLYDVIMAGIAQVAQREGYELVLIDDSDVAAPQNPGEPQMLGYLTRKKVLYSAPHIDITADVIDYLNVQYRNNARP